MKTFNLDALTEQELFVFIYEMDGTVWAFEHELADGRMESTPELEEDIRSARKQIVAAVGLLPKFGVDSLESDGKTSTTAYWEWYEKMKEWHIGLGDVRQAIIRKRVFDDNG